MSAGKSIASKCIQHCPLAHESSSSQLADSEIEGLDGAYREWIDSIDPSCLRKTTSRVKPRSDVDNSQKRGRGVFAKSLVEVAAAVEPTNFVRRWVEEMKTRFKPDRARRRGCASCGNESSMPGENGQLVVVFLLDIPEAPFIAGHGRRFGLPHRERMTSFFV